MCINVQIPGAASVQVYSAVYAAIVWVFLSARVYLSSIYNVQVEILYICYTECVQRYNTQICPWDQGKLGKYPNQPTVNT